jgi:hypothetical protein
MTMIEKAKNNTRHVLCARLIYAGLALTYAAACYGLDKQLVYFAAAGLYVLMVLIRH